MSQSMSDDAAEEIKSSIFAGHKIAAIKKYREISGTGLAEAKTFVEALELELRKTEPERFSAASPAGCGAGVLCVIVAAAAAAAMI